MEEGLMHICQHWGNSDCHEAVKENAFISELSPGDSVPLMACGEDLKRLDEICKNCTNNAFSIEKPECPICGTVLIERGAWFKSFSSGPVKPSEEVFIYKCRKCNRVLNSHIDFFGA